MRIKLSIVREAITLAYAVDVYLIGNTKDNLKKPARNYERIAQRSELQINGKKTDYTRLSKSENEEGI